MVFASPIYYINIALYKEAEGATLTKDIIMVLKCAHVILYLQLVDS